MTIHVWLDKVGVVTRIELVELTNDLTLLNTLALIKKNIVGKKMKSPPSDMPMPIVLRLNKTVTPFSMQEE
jgi:hypothetical protein